MTSIQSDGVVAYHQNARAVEAIAVRLPLAFPLRLQGKATREMKSTALSRLAFDFDLATHHSHKMLADREASLQLAQFLLGSHAYARVANLEPQTDMCSKPACAS